MLCNHTESASFAGPPRIGAWVSTARNRCVYTRLSAVFTLCLLGLVSVVTSAAMAAVSYTQSRAEAQAPHWLERAVPETGSGVKELREGMQKFEEQDLPGALGSFIEARKLGVGTRVEEVALFLATECRARSAVGEVGTGSVFTLIFSKQKGAEALHGTAPIL